LYQGRPDLLKKMPGKSKFGNYYYEPIEIKSTKDIHTEQKYQLVFYRSGTGANTRGVFRLKPLLINRHKAINRAVFDGFGANGKKPYPIWKSSVNIIKGSKPPLKLVSSCKQSPWFSKCVAEAEAANEACCSYRLDCRGASGIAGKRH